MVSLHVTAFGYLIQGKSAPEVYECLSVKGYLEEGADRQSVTALIEGSLQKRLDFGNEYWRVIQEDLLKANVLSPKGISAAKKFITRDGKRVWPWRT